MVPRLVGHGAAPSGLEWSGVAAGPGRLFAAVGGREVRIFQSRTTPWEMPDDGREPLPPKTVQAYLDPTLDEEFMTCVWSGLTLLFGGQKGVVAGVDVRTRKSIPRPLFGHGQRINSIAVSPKDPALVLTGSADESVRLWNINTGALIALFGGERGHRGEVLHVAFDAVGENILSSGMDNSIRIWSLAPCLREIRDSQSVHDSPDGYMVRSGDRDGKMQRAWSPKTIQLPFFATRTVHPYFVDCAEFVGHLQSEAEFLVLSKSTHDCLLLFLTRPAKDQEYRQRSIQIQGRQDILAKLSYQGGTSWFTKFATSPDLELVAVGNNAGEVFVFNLSEISASSATITHCVKLEEHPKRPRGLIRQCAFSHDGSRLIAVGIKGTVSEWDVSCLKDPT